jgi:tetratricopeptide (TPR) repeat protein
MATLHTSTFAALLVVAALPLACTPAGQRRTRVLEDCERAVAAGDLERAKRALTQHLRFAPKDVVVCTRLAMLLEQEERPAAAAHLLSSLPDHVQLDVPARLVLGRSLLHCHSLDRCVPILVALQREDALPSELAEELLSTLAISSFVEALAPALPLDWRRRLVERCLQADAVSKAVLALKAIHVADPQAAALTDMILRHALERGHFAAVAPYPELYVSGTRQWQLLATHQLYLATRQWDLASKVGERLLERFPDTTFRYDILLGMARKAVRTGDYQAGIRHANAAIRVDPGRTEALLEKGRALQGLGKKQEAQQVFAMVLDLDPDHPIGRRLKEAQAAQAVELHLTTSGTSGTQ